MTPTGICVVSVAVVLKKRGDNGPLQYSEETTWSTKLDANSTVGHGGVAWPAVTDPVSIRLNSICKEDS